MSLKDQIINIFYMQDEEADKMVALFKRWTLQENLRLLEALPDGDLIYEKKGKTLSLSIAKFKASLKKEMSKT